MPISPTLFQVSYLSVRYLGVKGQQIAAVRSYRSGDVGKRPVALKAYNDMLRFLRKKSPHKNATHNITEAELPGSDLRAAFNGKGSLNTCRNVLRLVDHYLADPSAIPHKDLGWSHTNVSVQDYADWYLGLDCNGFVGHYFQEAFPVSTIGPSTDCNDFDNKAHKGVRRASLEEIRPLDVLVREGGSGTRHVALIESIHVTGPKTANIRLVQSAHSRNGLSSAYENVTWLREPGSGSQTKSVMSLNVNGYMDFSYAIGYPWANA
jgi:hypothetical protein